MKTTTTILAVTLALVGGPLLAQETVYVSPDVPTDPGITFDYLPWDVLSYYAGSYATPPVLTIPGDPAVDAIQKLDLPGSWLFSVEAPTDLAGLLPVDAEPRDVLLDDGSSGYSFHFCGGAVTGAVPLEVNIDAIFADPLTAVESGDLFVSFDVPTTILSNTYDPADLVRYERTVIPGGCADWQLAGLEFDASAAGTGIATSSNVIGADRRDEEIIMVLDVPSDLAPSTGPTTYLPGHVASWDGSNFNLWESLASWPLSSAVDALSCQTNPGLVEKLTVDKSSITAGDLTLTWTPSCASGADDYGIYEGTLGTWYDHVQIDCHDGLADLTEEVTPPAIDTYYLVVPYNAREGSYGTRNDAGTLTERPQAAAASDRCVIQQQVTACP